MNNNEFNSVGLCWAEASRRLNADKVMEKKSFTLENGVVLL